MIIVIDSREQLPFSFSAGVETRTAALAVGDYSIAGFEDQIVIERKSLSDLLGSITHDRERFTRELRQLRSYRFAALVIEAQWSDVLAGRYRADVHPNSVIGSLMAFSVKYGVIPVLADDHKTGAALTERLLFNFARLVERDWKALQCTAEGTTTRNAPRARRKASLPGFGDIIDSMEEPGPPVGVSSITGDERIEP